MANERMFSERIREVTQSILEDYKNGRDIDKMDVFSQPDSDAVTDIVKKLLNILFPGYYREKNYRSYNDNSRISILIEDVVYNLIKQIVIALPFRDDCAQMDEAGLRDMAEEIAVEFIGRIPMIPSSRRSLGTERMPCFRASEGEPNLTSFPVSSAIISMAV